VAVIRKNIADLGLPGVSVRADTVERVLAGGPGSGDERYDLVLADPPYDVTEAGPRRRAHAAGDPPVAR
jgi:16S rRNA (guanine966-N2)-methyltransferase